MDRVLKFTYRVGGDERLHTTPLGIVCGVCVLFLNILNTFIYTFYQFDRYRNEEK